MDKWAEMKEWEKRNIRCSVCLHRYIIKRLSPGMKKTVKCPQCDHSFQYIEGS